jgi:2-hydroxy-dATP diphosphatase / coenzyme A diphosphatase
VLILDPDIRVRTLRFDSSWFQSLMLNHCSQPILNEPEVSALFSHPLHSFLSRTAPFDVRHEPHSAPHPNAPNHAGSSSKPHLRALSAYGTHATKTSITDLPSEAVREAKSQQRTAEPTVGLFAQSEASRASSEGWKRSPPDSSDAPKREYYSYRDIPWGQSLVRMHRFLTGREELGVKPVYGLTA